MRIISHRGNIRGSNLLTENSPRQIELAIKVGYDVEIDLRVSGGKLYLGHDYPKYKIRPLWLYNHSKFLWIHCKDPGALEIMNTHYKYMNYFTHDKDPYTITSFGIVWCHPDSMYIPGGVWLFPEQKDDIIPTGCYAICTDWPEKYHV